MQLDTRNIWGTTIPLCGPSQLKMAGLVPKKTPTFTESVNPRVKGRLAGLGGFKKTSNALVGWWCPTNRESLQK